MLLETLDALRQFNYFKPQFGPERAKMALGYRFTEIVVPKLERTATHVCPLPTDGFDWLIMACIVEAFVGAPSMNFAIQTELADGALQLPIIGAPDWTIDIGPFLPIAPSTWVQTFGSINHFEVSHGLNQFVTRFPLVDSPVLIMQHNNDNPITYSIGVAMGRGA